MRRGATLRRPAGPLALSEHEDYQPTIQAQLDAALAAGKKLFTLPAGVSYYGSAIVIPKGTSDLTIQGAPDGSTVLRALNDFSANTALVEIARETNVNNIWDGGGTHSALETCLRGSYTVRVSSTGDPPVLEPGKWYAIGDQATIPFLDSGSWVPIKYRAELVQCVAWHAESRTATLAAPLERDYDTTPSALHLQASEENLMCQNIALKNFKVDGMYGGGVQNPLRTAYGIWASLTYGLTVEGVTAKDFTTDHIRGDVCRSIRVSSSRVENSASVESTNDSPPDRGFAFFQCVDTELRDITAHLLRHGIEFASANSGFLVDGFVATSSQDAPLDCHGTRNQYGVLRNFDLDTRCKIGNISFPAGDQNIRVENGVCGRALEIQGGSGDLQVVNVAARNLLWTTIRDQTADYPHDCEYISCVFTNFFEEDDPNNNCLTCSMSDGDGTGDLFRRFANQSFKYCTLVQEIDSQTNEAWCVFFEALGIDSGLGSDSDASFTQCNFASNNDLELILNENQEPNNDITLTFDGCWFDSISNTQYAQRYKVGSSGACTIENSTFVTDFPTDPEFVLDQSGGGMDITLNDNTISGH